MALHLYLNCTFLWRVASVTFQCSKFNFHILATACFQCAVSPLPLTASLLWSTLGSGTVRYVKVNGATQLAIPSLNSRHEADGPKLVKCAFFFSLSQSSPKSNPHWSLHFQNEWIHLKWHLNLRIANPAGNLKWLYEVCLTPSLSVPSCLFPCVPLTLLPILLWSLFFLDDQVLWAEW